MTMRDVAKAAGVSQPTVSHVLNDTASISPAVREKVLSIIDQMGYTQDAIAKSLKTRKTNVVGLIIPDASIGYYAEIISTVERELRNEGLILFLCNTLYNPDLEEQYIKALLQHNVSGIIVGYGLYNTDSYSDALKNDIPLVTLDDTFMYEENFIPYVRINNDSIASLAANHLYKIGARKIAFVSEPLFNDALKQRYAGFKSSLKELGLEFDESRCFIEHNQYDKIDMGYNLGANIVLDNSIDAAFASSDQLAFGIIKRLKEFNRKTPDEIAIMGCDDAPLAKLISPELTTIAQPKTEMAKIGTHLLIKQINGQKLDYNEKGTTLEPSLIIRTSTMKKNGV